MLTWPRAIRTLYVPAALPPSDCVAIWHVCMACVPWLFCIDPGACNMYPPAALPPSDCPAIPAGDRSTPLPNRFNALDRLACRPGVLAMRPVTGSDMATWAPPPSMQSYDNPLPLASLWVLSISPTLSSVTKSVVPSMQSQDRYELAMGMGRDGSWVCGRLGCQLPWPFCWPLYAELFSSAAISISCFRAVSRFQSVTPCVAHAALVVHVHCWHLHAVCERRVCVFSKDCQNKCTHESRRLAHPGPGTHLVYRLID